MKKLLLIITAALFLNACEKENSSLKNGSTIENNPALAFDIASEDSTIGIYKGVFTTEDSQTRGIIEMTIPGTSTFVAYYGQFPTATLTLANGDIINATANRTIGENESVNNVQFNGNGFSFILSMNDNGKNVLFSNVTLNGTTSYALVKKHTNRAPITPITGIYQCIECQGHPNLEIGDEQSFNVVINEGTGEITTSVMLSTVEFTGTGTQNNCNANGVLTSCNTIGAFDVVDGTNITWDGTHLFNNEASGANDCSDFDGAWTWITNSYGTISGTFSSDVTSCTQNSITLVSEDFEGIPTYVGPADDLSDAGNKDYYGVITPGALPADVVIEGAANNYYGAQDTNSATTPINEIALQWNNIDISSFNTIDFSADFAEDIASDGDNDWNAESTARLEYSFDGTTWTPVIAFESESVGGSETNQLARLDSDFDGIGDTGAAFLNGTLTNYSATLNLAGESTLSVRVLIDGIFAGDEDIAVDNILVEGN